MTLTARADAINNLSHDIVLDDKFEELSLLNQKTLLRYITNLVNDTSPSLVIHSYEKIVNEFENCVNQEALIQLLHQKLLATKLQERGDFYSFFDAFNRVEMLLNNEQKSAVEKYFWYNLFALANSQDQESTHSIDILSFKQFPDSFNKNLRNRLLFRRRPADPLLNSNQLVDRLYDRKPINHIEILSLLNSQSLTWFNLKRVIAKATPAAKSMLTRVLFTVSGQGILRSHFALDETLQPVNDNAEPMHFSDDAICKLVIYPLYSFNYNNWPTYFGDFKITPMFNYFE